jgi:succinylglutamate desuccinylase
VLEIRHRHVCHDGDGFEMGEGYRNFQPVSARQVVAVDDAGDISIPESGIMMMPRYQGQGEDGFFLAREVKGVWLEMSRLLRRARADRLVAYLPGVRPHPDREDHFILDPRVARFKPTEILHLFGYRRKRKRDEGLVFSRRRPDFGRPDESVD